MILLDDVNIDLINVVSLSGIDSKIAALGVVEGAGREGFMGGTYKSTMHPEGANGEGVCAACGGPVLCIQQV